MTDAVILLIDNDKGALEAALWMARKAHVDSLNHTAVLKRSWTRGEAIIFLLADMCKAWLEKYIASMPAGRFEGGLRASLVQHSFEPSSDGTVATEYFSNAEQRWLSLGEAKQTWS
jgi:hypothetical protein